jgi:hypothetical protein
VQAYQVLYCTKRLDCTVYTVHTHTGKYSLLYDFVQYWRLLMCFYILYGTVAYFTVPLLYCSVQYIYCSSVYLNVSVIGYLGTHIRKGVVSLKSDAYKVCTYIRTPYSIFYYQVQVYTYCILVLCSLVGTVCTVCAEIFLIVLRVYVVTYTVRRLAYYYTVHRIGFPWVTICSPRYCICSLVSSSTYIHRQKTLRLVQ